MSKDKPEGTHTRSSEATRAVMAGRTQRRKAKNRDANEARHQDNLTTLREEAIRPRRTTVLRDYGNPDRPKAVEKDLNPSKLIDRHLFETGRKP